MNEDRKYNIFIFISTFARGMVEVFVPLVLLEKGFSLKSIFLYYIIRFITVLILNKALVWLGKIIKFKWLLVLSSFLFGFAFYYLSLMGDSLEGLIAVAIFMSLYIHTHWAGRHYYALEVLPSKQMGDEVGNIIIFGDLALIPSAYIGAILIERLGLQAAILGIIVLAVFSIYPLFTIREDRNRAKDINVLNIMKRFPPKSFRFTLLDQFRLIGGLFFSLYIYLFVQNNYEFIGIFNIVVGIASMVFTYIFARKMDKDKKDYLWLSASLLASIWLLKVNVELPLLMLVVGLLEGLGGRMYDTSAVRNMYSLGKQFDAPSYIVFYEATQHIGRLIIMLIAYFLVPDIKIMIYICIIGTFLAGLNGFDDGKGEY